MKKFILPETGVDLKANLHCHSTLSDGKLTPEQLKEAYKAHGYAIIAYTDHNKLIDHQDLNDDSFLALNGYEIDITEDTPDVAWVDKRTCHICLVAKTPDKAPIELDRIYTPENINAVISRAKDAGFYVTYNHPTWSLESYPEYSQYEGMDAMEICNGGCLIVAYDEYNCHAYDDMLKLGRRVFCIGTDDNHNGRSLTDPLSSSFVSWTVIRAEKLDYASVIEALEKGYFYASNGPEIKELYVEDGFVHVKTSDAHIINYITAGRHREVVGAHYGQWVNEAKFPIRETDRYFRIDVIDEHGRHANSSAVFLDTL
ncbi:MAG: CehA/McbA family metallohydrolase [Clostridia bacterium]|nr:CehA/McbA family metallohydrolase [Clostridia bacterium]